MESKLHSLFRLVLRGILSVLIIGICVFNYGLYYTPKFENDLSELEYNKDVYDQLKYLKGVLQDGAADDMQGLFPEGYLFINSLYGLTWYDLISKHSVGSQLYREGIVELSWVVKKTQSEKAKSTFIKDMEVEYGAFYLGWSNYLLGKKLELQPIDQRESEEVLLFKENCTAISNALESIDSPYLESYPKQKWPADGIIAVSSLALYKEVFDSNRYELQLMTWIEQVKTKLDPQTGLIPHSVYSETDDMAEAPRGSSQSLLLSFLFEIDSVFGEQQFQLYREHFLTSRFALPGIKEYLEGEEEYGDIDSGPVIYGIGGAASIVGQRTMAIYKDYCAYVGLRNCIENFGLGINWGTRKSYLFGSLPMVDAFIAWSNSVEQSSTMLDKVGNWRFNFQFLSCVLLLLFIGLWIKL